MDDVARRRAGKRVWHGAALREQGRGGGKACVAGRVQRSRRVRTPESTSGQEKVERNTSYKLREAGSN
jgi:hypothetical protein